MYETKIEEHTGFKKVYSILLAVIFFLYFWSRENVLQFLSLSCVVCEAVGREWTGRNVVPFRAPRDREALFRALHTPRGTPWGPNPLLEVQKLDEALDVYIDGVATQVYDTVWAFEVQCHGQYLGLFATNVIVCQIYVLQLNCVRLYPLLIERLGEGLRGMVADAAAFHFQIFQDSIGS